MRPLQPAAKNMERRVLQTTDIITVTKPGVQNVRMVSYYLNHEALAYDEQSKSSLMTTLK